MAVGRSSHTLLGTDKLSWHNETLWNVRDKRDRAAIQLPEWEELRSLASQIKEHTLANLGSYLEEFERNAVAHGVKVHWAITAEDHNRIVGDILKRNGAKKIVKSKSMLTEECGLNEYLEHNGFEVIDTDLGERIIQLKNEPPSHIVAPAIHMKKEEISELFHKELGTEQGNSDPNYLTEAARQHLRTKFLEADAGLTGVNFAVAETGGVVVVTNEGNADIGVHASALQIHCMGIEKLVPRLQDLGVFTRLLARSATGQALSIYTSHYQSPQQGGQMHIVLVDNGRSEHLKKPTFRSALKCIRCGACMNTCPVYRRIGGHSYDATIPGPIGSILNPRFDSKRYKELPFASSLCGSCSDVCPVKIDIHHQLYAWRQEIDKESSKSFIEKWITSFAASTLSHPKLFDRRMRVARRALKIIPKFLLRNRWNPWMKGRELPDPPRYSFKEWYKKNHEMN